MVKISFLVIAILGGFIIYSWFPRGTMCKLRRSEYFTIASVQNGLFSEYIPQTGILVRDTIANTSIVKVVIDELYLPRVVRGLKAATTILNTDYTLEITHVYPEVIDGRFTVDMIFKETYPADFMNGRSVRLRLALSEPRQALLVPVGGFYKDTGGEWMFVVENSARAVKRNVKLGRKNTEYFEVLEGLKPGDQVITSSYEEFKDQESLDLNEIRNPKATTIHPRRPGTKPGRYIG